MSSLYLNPAGELCLTLRGAAENRILATVRRWPHWQRVDIERDPLNMADCSAITLITDPIFESTVRDILKRSFGMTFPTEGGVSALPPEPPSVGRRRKR